MAIHTDQRSLPTANSLQAHAHGEFAGTLHSLSLPIMVEIRFHKTTFDIKR